MENDDQETLGAIVVELATRVAKLEQDRADLASLFAALVNGLNSDDQRPARKV